MDIIELLKSLPTGLRIISLVLSAVTLHFLVHQIRRLSNWLLSIRLSPGDLKTENILKRYPKIVTITTLMITGTILWTIHFYQKKNLHNRYRSIS